MLSFNTLKAEGQEGQGFLYFLSFFRLDLASNWARQHGLNHSITPEKAILQYPQTWLWAACLKCLLKNKQITVRGEKNTLLFYKCANPLKKKSSAWSFVCSSVRISCDKQLLSLFNYCNLYVGVATVKTHGSFESMKMGICNDQVRLCFHPDCHWFFLESFFLF